MSVEQKSSDDNIISRRKHVKDSLNIIRDKKERLHAAMKSISQSEEPDKEMIAKLLEAFDMMTEQENQYLDILKNIVEIHELAVDDVAKEIEEKKKSFQVAEAQKEVPVDEETKPEEETTAGVPATEEEVSELEACLRELQEVSAAASAASQLHEQLVEKLQLQKSKKTTLNEIRKEKTSTMRKQATEVMTEMEIAKLKVSTEKTAKDRKEKQLDRLRKEALKRGIQVGAEEEKEKEEMIAAVESSVERIPPVQNEDEKEEEIVEEKTEEEKIEERRKEIRENVKKEREKKEQINQQIRERLKAMEARKERIRALRIALLSAEAPESDDQAREALEEMFQNASANLSNLTAMRERLEAMASNENENGSTDEIEEEVRRRFERAMKPSSAEPRDSYQFDRIESLLLEQNKKIDELTRRESSVVRFRQSLLTAPVSLLHGLAECLLQLAVGQSAPSLDAYLSAILEGVSEKETKEERVISIQSKKVDTEVSFVDHESTHPPPPTALFPSPEIRLEHVIEDLLVTDKMILEETDTIEMETAQKLREMTCHLISQRFPFVKNDITLGTQVHDLVQEYLGIRSADCLENILYDLKELYSNEVTFYKLMDTANRIPNRE